MGNNLNSDDYLKVCIILDKDIFVVGQMVSGTVCIRTTAHRPYQSLYIGIAINQSVYWTQQHNRRTYAYSQKLTTYNEQFILAKFNQGIGIGQYSFPFSLLLPGNIPANFEKDNNNYIRTTLRAYLPPYDGNSKMQAFDINLNLRQPLRFQLPLNTGKIQSFTTCCCNCCSCCCCAIYQSCDIQFQLEKNIINFNEQTRLRGFIDNRNGAVLIQRITSVSVQKSKQVSSEVAVLHNFNKSISAGERVQIDLPIVISNISNRHTAIGVILARQFFINLVADNGCCYNSSVVSKHIIFNNQYPNMQYFDYNNIKNMLANFNPVKQQPIHFVNLRPYVYNPSPSIKDLNQGYTGGQMNSNPYDTLDKIQNGNF